MVLEIYSDIPIDNTEIYPYKIINEEAVKQAITTILTTFDGQRLFRPELDFDLENFLWDPLDDITELAVKNHIMVGLEKWEPRITVEELVFQRDEKNEKLYIVLYYKIIGFDNESKEQIVRVV